MMSPDCELGMRRMKEISRDRYGQLPQDIALLEVRLQQNLRDGRLYGDDPRNRAEWARIMHDCIRVSQEMLGINFNDLCQPEPSVDIPSSRFVKGERAGSDTPHYHGTGKRWAVLAGVASYDDKRCYASLPVCAKDVTAISQQLRQGGFAQMQVMADDTVDSSGRPTRENILASLKATADATRPDDLLLFYYTGHGDIDENESYLVAANGRMAYLKGTAIPITMVREIMRQAEARSKVIVLDACHAGANTGKGARTMRPEFIRRVFEQAEGLVILASCKQSQLSYILEEEEQSVYTYYLLEALCGQADSDGKGFVTVNDIHRYVTNGLGEWSARHRCNQTPTIHTEMAGEIMVCRYS